MPKLIIKKKATEPSPFLGQPSEAEYKDFVRRAEGMDDFALRAEWADRIGRGAGVYPRWLLVQGLSYHWLVKGQVRVQGDASPKVMHRYRLTIAGDMKALKRESDFLVGEFEEGTGGSEMKIKEKRKGERRAGKITAGSVLVKLLGAEKVASDEQLIKEVREATGSKLFDERQLAWYKWKFRQGKLKGQDGKSQVINQGSPLKASKNGHSKKKIVIKKK